jgi:hypothetical protein
MSALRRNPLGREDFQAALSPRPQTEAAHMKVILPSPERLAKARAWWEQLPDAVKAGESIWTILALYGVHILQTETVAFDEEA